MRVLIISVHYPPISGTSSRVIAELSRVMAGAGYEVHVLTVQPVADHPVYRFSPEGSPIIPETVRVHRIPMGPINRLIARAMKPPIAVAPQSSPSYVGGGVRRCVNWIYQARRLWEPLAIPDASIDWLPRAAFEARRLLRQSDFDLVVSLGNPHTCHLVALFATRGQRCQWVPFYGDSWALDPTLITRPAWTRTINRMLERRALKATAGVAVWTDAMKQSIMSAYGIDPARIVTSLLAYADLNQYETVEPRPDTDFHVVYTGNIYGTLQDPLPFFRAASRIDRAELMLSFIGSISQEYAIAAGQLGLNAEFPGWHTPHQVVKDQKNATVLLIFGHQGGHVMPSKIYEYFAARRPVLCVRGDEQDMVAPLIQKHRRGLTVDNREEDIEQALRKLIDLHRRRRLDSSFDLSLLSQYSASETARSLMNGIIGALAPQALQAGASGAGQAVGS
jgi:glycosyltransferase involved in cell wall biosynthesis